MCGGFLGEIGSFIKDSVEEVFHNPLQALGAVAGVPGYDPLIGGIFNNGKNGALFSPTGNFSQGAWQDMYNAHPNDIGGLNLFHSVNDVADKIAPAVAGGFAAPALSGALGGAADTGAATFGPSTFSTGLSGGAADTGALESGLGGAAMFGPSAGTGMALGSGAGLGSGLGVAGGSSLGSLGATGGLAGALGGAPSGASGGLNNIMSGVSGPGPSGGAPMSPGGTSLEGSQAVSSVPGGMQGVEGPQFSLPEGTPGSGSLSTMFGPQATSTTVNPMGSEVANSTAGMGGQSVPSGSWLSHPENLESLMKVANSGLGAYQQYQKAQQAKNYANSIAGIFGPNSPYAQQMQQTIGRQAAAMGRNSQQGPQAVQLAAALAQAQANALGGSNYAQAAQNGAGSGILNSMFSNFSSPGGISSLYNIGKGLASIF